MSGARVMANRDDLLAAAQALSNASQRYTGEIKKFEQLILDEARNDLLDRQHYVCVDALESFLDATVAAKRLQMAYAKKRDE